GEDVGRGLNARPAGRRRDRQLRAWRDQRQFGVPDPRRGTGRDRPPSCRSAAVEAVNGPLKPAIGLPKLTCELKTARHRGISRCRRRFTLWQTTATYYTTPTRT